jgi:hypothetical protein
MDRIHRQGLWLYIMCDRQELPVEYNGRMRTVIGAYRGGTVMDIFNNTSNRPTGFDWDTMSGV